jgi:coenzyme F420-dependent glucose-6-phosphate dehydrogenase
MPSYGYTLSSEEHGPRDLLEAAVRAEEVGFDFVSASDHFHPWISAQGHSPFVWSVLGAIAARTQRIGAAIGVTCPIIRTHPAIVAHAAATTAVLFGDRFVLGVGTGEALNEHVHGDRWPTPAERRDMLEEAIEVMRALWTGDTVDRHGSHYVVENARLFDPPPGGAVPLIVSGFGAEAARIAGRLGDGYWGHSTDTEVLDAYREAGGSGPMYAQLNLCWAEDADHARKTVHRVWPNSSIPGQLSQDLPTWTHFEQASELVDEEHVTKSTPCGPDIVEELLRSVDEYEAAGYDHLYFHQIGPDQAGFFDFWERELGPALRRGS